MPPHRRVSGMGASHESLRMLTGIDERLLLEVRGHALIGGIALLGSFVVLFENRVDNLGRILLVKRIVANFALQELDEITGRFLGIKREGVFALKLEKRIEAVQVPITGGDGILLVLLRRAHSGLNPVVDTRRIADDKRRAVISLRFKERL